MNLGLFLKEEQYQSTIYLNDRVYDVLDIGEGKSIVIVVTSIKDYMDENHNLDPEHRLIVVDISKTLQEMSDNLALFELILANDLHLLFDVFWLEEVEVLCEVDSLNMNEIHKVARTRNYSRAELNKG